MTFIALFFPWGRAGFSLGFLELVEAFLPVVGDQPVPLPAVPPRGQISIPSKVFPTPDRWASPFLIGNSQCLGPLPPFRGCASSIALIKRCCPVES